MAIGKLARLMLLALAGATPAFSTPVTAPTFEARLLAAHNSERARLGQPQLVWNDVLAKHARDWAEKLAKNDSFEHAPQNAEGENLWSGTSGVFSAEEMVGLWVEEKKFFKPGLFPNVSSSGNWIDVGHYTQLVWKDTRQVGCALARGKEDDVLVCRYDPPGNWIGRPVLGKAAVTSLPTVVKRRSARKPR